MKKLLFYLVAALLLFAVYGALNLSITDFQKKDICPKVLGIPACYIVLLFFALGFVFHFLGKSMVTTWWYYGALCIPFFRALSGTVSQLSGHVVCPRTAGGTPMCFISLGFCTLLILLKLLENKMSI